MSRHKRNCITGGLISKRIVSTNNFNYYVRLDVGELDKLNLVTHKKIPVWYNRPSPVGVVDEFTMLDGLNEDMFVLVSDPEMLSSDFIKKFRGVIRETARGGEFFYYYACVNSVEEVPNHLIYQDKLVRLASREFVNRHSMRVNAQAGLVPTVSATTALDPMLSSKWELVRVLNTVTRFTESVLKSRMDRPEIEEVSDEVSDFPDPDVRRGVRTVAESLGRNLVQSANQHRNGKRESGVARTQKTVGRMKRGFKNDETASKRENCG